MTSGCNSDDEDDVAQNAVSDQVDRLMSTALSQISGVFGKLGDVASDYNQESGLAGLETALNLSSSGDPIERVDAIVAEVRRRLPLWKRMTPSAIAREHAVMSGLFTVSDRVTMFAYLNEGRLPSLWWARLACELRDQGLYDEMMEQIHRETMSSMAQDVMKEERSFGGKIKAENSPIAAAKKDANDLWPMAKRKGLTATQFHTELTDRGHTIASETSRKWLTKLRQTGSC